GWTGKEDLRAAHHGRIPRCALQGAARVPALRVTHHVGRVGSGAEAPPGARGNGLQRDGRGRFLGAERQAGWRRPAHRLPALGILDRPRAQAAHLMQQLPLAISQGAAPEFDNFVAGPNAEALTRVRELAAGTLGERIVYLWGAGGSGRSHLLCAAGRANPALVLADDVETLEPT